MPARGPSGPWQRLKPVELDPLESMGLPSKGETSPVTDQTRLHDHKNQERYYTRIVERYLSFCSDATDRDSLLEKFGSLSIGKERGGSSGTDASAASGTGVVSAVSTAPSFPVPTLPQTGTKDLPTVLMALRKLREGLVASKRIDDFATQAYLFNVRTAILVKHSESYHPAILYLLRTIHPKHPLTTFELREVTGYLVLDAACRRGDLAEAFALRNRFKLRDAKVDAILQALARDDFIAFGRVKATVDGHQAKFLEFCEDGLRRHTLKCFGRAYLSVDVPYLEKATGATFLELVERDGVGWHSDGSKVVIRSIKGRS
ncbi:hypothetical protein DHEL01_v206237 [Diaporthe helianthi]|uniref:CSN8/PSMD8/EIF3K domain-containing protein n=1 Tax=Diaporthe helianthi TaxID=158607 RepID=A0A2P5HYP2_DIAHE|nr:hypothetical protein DHEL01_v206237 [Diaporthe helianthi]